MSSLDERLEGLSDAEKEMILGSSLSQRFAAWPLAFSHPTIVSAFYGLLLSIALLLPIGMHNQWQLEAWLTEALLRTVMVCVGLAILGQFSALVLMVSKRPPITPPRVAIFTAPFIGFALLLAIWTDMTTLFPDTLAWFLMLAPGPVYVHFSWAPRHRMLVMLEDGKDPFGAQIQQVGQREMEAELEEAVNSLEI